MSKKAKKFNALFLTVIVMFMACKGIHNINKNVKDAATITTGSIILPLHTCNSVEIVTEEEQNEFDKDVELIALVTMAEAEGECEEGKRLVIDTILNRRDSKYFPDTIRDVIYQHSQFTSMWNGRVSRCFVREDIYRLVLEEMESRTNYHVIFFNSGRYSKYGTPMFQVENHYFSSYS